MDFNEDDDGASLASGHGGTIIVDIGKDDRNYGTNSFFFKLMWVFRSSYAHLDEFYRLWS